MVENLVLYDDKNYYSLFRIKFPSKLKYKIIDLLSNVRPYDPSKVRFLKHNFIILSYCGSKKPCNCVGFTPHWSPSYIYIDPNSKMDYELSLSREVVYLFAYALYENGYFKNQVTTIADTEWLHKMVELLAPEVKKLLFSETVRQFAQVRINVKKEEIYDYLIKKNIENMSEEEAEEIKKLVRELGIEG